MYKRLRFRLTLICTIITGIILFGMTCASLYIAQSQLAGKGEAGFESDVNTILYHIRSQNIIDHTWISQMEYSSELILELYFSGNVLLYSGSQDREIRAALVEQAKERSVNAGLDITIPPRTLLNANKVEFPLENNKGQLYYGAAVNIPMEKGWVGLYIIKSKEKESHELAVQRILFGGVMLVSMLLLFLFSWVFTTRAIAPIEKNRKKQIQFVSSASHELRSPLAVIRTSISAMKEASIEEANRFYEAADSECIRMSRLIDDMLLLASVDESTWSVQKEESEAETLLLTAYENFEKTAYEKGIHLQISLPEKPLPKLWCDFQRIIQVLSILIDNGITYTPNGGSICLSVEKYHEKLKILIADNGPGIEDNMKSHIFQRFYRADVSRSNREHYGLGLCVAKEIVNLHKGNLTVEDTKGGGATFVVVLPL